MVAIPAGIERQAVLLDGEGEAEPAIPSIDWWITSRCNLACDFCYGPVPTCDPAELRAQIAVALAASPAETITFCGGEPLILGEEVFEYARLFRAAGKRVVLNTNGELLEHAARKFLQSSEELPFDVIGVSVEGPTQETHSEMRRGANLAATFDGARLVKAHGKSLKIASVVSSVSQKWLPAMVEFAHYGLDADVLRLYHYNPNGDYNRGQDRHSLNKEGFKEAIQGAVPYAWQLPVYPSDNESQGCLIVDPEGKVSVSTKGGYESLGNCLNEPINQIWARQPESIHTLVDRNKRWIGSTAVSAAMDHCLGPSIGPSMDFGLPARLDLSSGLPGAQRLVQLRPDITAGIKQTCIDGLPAGMSAQAKELYWWHTLDSLIGCDGSDIVQAGKVVDLFMHYTTKYRFTRVGLRAVHGNVFLNAGAHAEKGDELAYQK